MKKIIFISVLLFCLNFSYSQNIDFKLIDKLINTSFVSIDELMIEGYGFRKLEDKSEQRKRTYARYYGDDFNNSIMITVFDAKDTPNVIDLSLAKNYNIRDIKDKLLEKGYEYSGSNEYGFVVYKNNKTGWAISKEPNRAGSNQIMIITEW